MADYERKSLREGFATVVLTGHSQNSLCHSHSIVSCLFKTFTYDHDCNSIIWLNFWAPKSFSCPEKLSCLDEGIE